ncbi:unnamed protein product [Ilex paraguariensis]|uniref:Leucine-rich repeat-containing N-terminal plant-type domain-containing protein n=1 Tax=Ilex paraguariensis TaxID=185542 RepID=A0ABC8SVJ5_9AQUA
MDIRSSCIPIVALLLILLIPFGNSQSSNILCADKERRALLSFRSGLIDSLGRLSSWSSAAEEDCCRWTGVRCDNVTGRVVGLHLRNPLYLNDDIKSFLKSQLQGKISPSLLELEFLSHLDLSYNNFIDSDGGIPSFLGSMKSLTYLDLSSSGFHGMVPHQLGNLSRLTYLGLGYNYGLFVDNLSWMSGLYSLKYLNMGVVKFGKEINWLQAMSTLSSLSELHLFGCGLESMYPSLGNVNFTSLTSLDLSGNHFKHEVPNWLGNLSSSLLSLDLSDNSLQGEIPIILSNLRSLSLLDLRINGFTGKIPEWLGQFKYLEYLALDLNSFYGLIPASLGNLSSLVVLSLSVNKLLSGNLPKNLGLLSNLGTLFIGDTSLTGVVSEEHFAKLSKLKNLDMSESNFSFNVSSNWIPPFQLKFIQMSSCKMGPKFPAWLQTQTFVELLSISNTQISDIAPNWFWNMVSRVEWFDLSNNQIRGDISVVLLNSTIINISSNHFKGELPRLSANVEVLNIESNNFSGYISSFLCCKENRRNNLEVLAASNNLLSGEISSCWGYWQSLTHLNLGSNNLSGGIPNSMGSLSNLHSLRLQKNSFSGHIPSSLLNCTSLGLIDFGENEFTGIIPSWMGEMANLLVLRLRSNRFNGNIPTQICLLASILIIDLANNSLSGLVPKCLNNLSRMAMVDNWDDGVYFDALEYSYDYGSYMENVLLVTKGRESGYNSILKFLRSIDLSSNNLFGSIPTEIFDLSGLRFLNMSHNCFVGEISENIGGMTTMECLDLSHNNLSGKIPQSMSKLTSLDCLNLSYNHLSGRIPSSTQLQSLNETSFIGNAGLCGAPLSINCSKDDKSQGSTPVHKNWVESEMFWFYIGMGMGFTMGVWGVCVVLFFKRSWRHAYFKFLDELKDQIYVAALLKVIRKVMERRYTFELS